jgi:hypothetical protein
VGEHNTLLEGGMAKRRDFWHAVTDRNNCRTTGLCLRCSGRNGFGRYTKRPPAMCRARGRSCRTSCDHSFSSRCNACFLSAVRKLYAATGTELRIGFSGIVWGPMYVVIPLNPDLTVASRAARLLLLNTVRPDFNVLAAAAIKHYLPLDNFTLIRYISAVGLRQFFTSQLLIYRAIDK